MSTNKGTGTNPARSPRLWLAIFIAAISLAFILQNRDPVAINLTVLSVTVPLWIALIAVYAAGFITGGLLLRRRGS